jgi:hypothetical protein
MKHLYSEKSEKCMTSKAQLKKGISNLCSALGLCTCTEVAPFGREVESSLFHFLVLTNFILEGVCKQGCKMVYFQTQNPNFGNFFSVLQWKVLVYFMAIWSILRPFDIFCDHLVLLMVS